MATVLSLGYFTDGRRDEDEEGLDDRARVSVTGSKGGV